MIKKHLLACVLTTCLPMAVAAQTNLRTQYNETLAIFNELVMNKQIGEALDLVKVDEVLTQEERNEYNGALIEAFPDPFVGSSPVQSEALKNGFRQELLAFWTGEGDYLYLYLVMHTDDQKQKVIDLKYSDDLTTLIGFF